MIASPFATVRSETKIEETKREARELLKSGVDLTNKPRATELILSILSDYPSGPATATIASWYNPLLLIGFVCAVVLSFRPKSALAIGKGVVSVKRQRLWIKFVTRIIPSFIFLGVLTSIIGNYITDYIKR